MRLKYLAVALVALLFASATSTVASVGEIRLYVDGLACPFCTFGIEKSLKKVPGVVSVEMPPCQSIQQASVGVLFQVCLHRSGGPSPAHRQ